MPVVTKRKSRGSGDAGYRKEGEGDLGTGRGGDNERWGDLERGGD